MSSGILLGRMWCFVGGFRMGFLNHDGLWLWSVEGEDIGARHSQSVRK